MDIESLDIYAAVASDGWGARFDSLTPEELGSLRLYDRLCRELGESTFFSERATFKFGAEGEQLGHAGADALRSMSMSFRQLWMPKEPAQFHRVLGILRRRTKPHSGDLDTRAVLDELGRRYRSARREVMMKHVWADDPVGEPKDTFDAERVIEDWLNGGRFHSDADAEARVASWSPLAYEWSLIKALHGVAGVMWELHFVVISVLASEPDAAAA